MIASVGTWVLRLSAAAVFAALGEGLMPEGPVRRVGRLACAIVVLLVALRPLTGARSQIPLAVDLDSEGYRAQLAEGSGEVLKEFIEQRLEAYITDKAAELGVICTCRVTCERDGEGTWLPDRIAVQGRFDASQRDALRRTIETELAVPPDRQSFTGGEGVEQSRLLRPQAINGFLRRYRYALLIVLVGAILMSVGGTGDKTTPADEAGQEETFDLEGMEHKLAQTLSAVSGAGRVTVMLTLKEGTRSVLAQDTRLTQDEQTRTNVIVSRGSGGERTVQVQSVWPRFQGALVVCDGADSAGVRLELVQAVRALTGLSAENISICKRK